MQVSRVMIVGWLTLIVSILAFPEFTALVPETYLPYVALISGAVTLVIRILNGNLGVNPLSVVGVITIAAGALSLPMLGAVIPATFMPTITALAGILTLIARFLAGQSPTDTAKPVGFVLHKTPAV